MSNHLRQEMDRLKRKLLFVGSMAEQSVRKAGLALKEMDARAARDVVTLDHQIDLKEVELEEDCLKIMALHQPVANDLRFVVAALKINNDLERIGDLGVNIAKRVIYLSKQKPISIPFDFSIMWTSVLEMLRQSLNALVRGDVKLARVVCEQDDIVDEINRAMYAKVYDGIKKEPQNAEALIHYLSISKYLERVADYATNISEDVIYMIDGKIVRHQPDQLFGNSPSTPAPASGTTLDN